MQFENEDISTGDEFNQSNNEDTEAQDYEPISEQDQAKDSAKKKKATKPLPDLVDFFNDQNNLFEPLIKKLLAALGTPLGDTAFDYDAKIFKNGKQIKSYNYSSKNPAVPKKSFTTAELLVPLIRRKDDLIVLYYHVKRDAVGVKVVVEYPKLLVYLLSETKVWKRVSARDISGYKYIGHTVEAGVLKITLSILQ